MQIKNIMSKDVIVIDKDQNVCDGLRLMKKNKISRLPVVNVNENHEKKLVGIATEKDIAVKLGSSKYGNLAPSHFHMSTVMANEIITVKENDNIAEVANLLIENNIGGVPVLSSSDELIGIVTKSDFIDTCKGKAYERIIVEDNMSTDIISLSVTDRLVHARRVILDSNIGRLLINENNELAGILTSKDIAKAMTSFRKHVPNNHQQAQIKNLLVGDIMSSNVQTIPTNTNIAELAELILKTGFNGFPVANEENQIVGIITKSDLLGLIVELETS
jgi:CBS domain-containing protein